MLRLWRSILLLWGLINVVWVDLDVLDMLHNVTEMIILWLILILFVGEDLRVLDAILIERRKFFLFYISGFIQACS